MSEELAHDAHLRAALRHAPDHALAPPSGLSHTILAAARQAHLPVRAQRSATAGAHAHPAERQAAEPCGFSGCSRRVGQAHGPQAMIAALGLGLWLDLGIEPVLDRPAAVATR